MSLVLPRLVDVLKGRAKSGEQFIIVPGTEQRQIDEFCTLAAQAEKFYFGDIQLERSAEIVQGTYTWKNPELTEVEQEAWDKGLIPMPAPVCWYEYRLGGYTTGLLVRGEPGNIEVQRVDFEKDGSSGVFSGMWGRRNDLADGSKLRFKAARSQMIFEIDGTPAQMQFVKNLHEQKGASVMNFAADFYFALWLTLMINSGTTEVYRLEEPEKLNRARVKIGKTPLPDHYVIDLYPRKYWDKESLATGTHASPRLHWRRSHLRHFDHQTPGSKWLASEVHNGSTGWFVTLIARKLVGVRELGEVTHEYRVKGGL